MKKLFVLLALSWAGIASAQLTQYVRKSTYISPAGATNYYVDRISGNDTNGCVQPSTPCFSITAAVAKATATKRIIGQVHIYVDGGVYNEGIGNFQNVTCETDLDPDGGSYLVVDGLPGLVLADAGSGLLASGTIASATNDNALTTTYATFTVNAPAGGYADGGLRGYLAAVVTNGNSPQYMEIGDNTSTVITVLGRWSGTTTPPTSGAAFAIYDRSVIIDGGVTQPWNYQQQTGRNFGNTAMSVGPYPNWTGALISNVHGGSEQPFPGAGNEASSDVPFGAPACVIIQGFKAGPGLTGFADITNSSDVNLRWNDVGATIGHSTGVGSGGFGSIIIGGNLNWNVTVGGNYGNFGAGTNGMISFRRSAGGYFGIGGNVQDNGGGFLGFFADGSAITGAAADGPINLWSSYNWIRGTSGTAWATMGGQFQYFKADTIQNAGGGNACMNVGQWHATSSTVDGSGVLVFQSGVYSGCTGDGLLFQGPGLSVALGVRGGVVSGTGNTGIGVVTQHGAHVVAVGATITGAVGDTEVDGANIQSWASMATSVGRTNLLDGSRIAINPGGQGGGAMRATTDTSGTPGAATANTACGRSAVASSASSVVITNNLVSTVTRVYTQLESKDATCTAIYLTPGSGSFTATCNSGATSTTKFNWCVEN